MKNLYILLLILIIVSDSCTKNNSLKNSPITIKQLNEIGELICAEYYGEAIESLGNIFYFQDTSVLHKQYNGIKSIYNNICKIYKLPLMRREAFENDGYTEYQGFDILLKASGKNLKHFLEEDLAKKTWEQFNNEYQIQIKNQLQKKNNISGLVYIGRGWVKAGFNLKDIDFKRQIEYRNDTAFIKNFDPIILNADINPWLLPDKIKGYEILKAENARNLTFEDITKVKISCKNKLKQEAINCGIYNSAIESCEETLEGLLNMSQLDNSNKILKVKILPSKYFEFKADFLKDSRIDNTEFEKIKELVKSDTVSIDSLYFKTKSEQIKYLKKFIDELFAETFRSMNADGWINYYTYLKLDNKK
jgi:hypothetical protein